MAQAQQEQGAESVSTDTILEQESPGSQAFQQQTDSLLKATTERVSSAMMPVKRLTQSTKVSEKLRDSSTQIRTTQTSTSGNLRSALQEEMGNFIQQSRISEIKQKYHSINSLKDSEKIQAVKDTSLNPFLFDNPVDGIANSMSRWAQDAPQFAGHTDGGEVAKSLQDTMRSSCTAVYQSRCATAVKGYMVTQCLEDGFNIRSFSGLIGIQF